MTDLQHPPTNTPTPPTPPIYTGNLGQTTLHLACMQGIVAKAKLLVWYVANPLLSTRDGFSVMHIAFSNSGDVLSLK